MVPPLDSSIALEYTHHKYVFEVPKRRTRFVLLTGLFVFPGKTTTQIPYFEARGVTTPEAPMGRPFLEYLAGRVYACRWCQSHFAEAKDIASRSFRSRNGVCYLFHECVNVSCGPAEHRHMLTGAHTVCDIHCNKCLRVVGWQYEHAEDESQRYKEGKFVLERCKVTREGVDVTQSTHPAESDEAEDEEVN